MERRFVRDEMDAAVGSIGSLPSRKHICLPMLSNIPLFAAATFCCIGPSTHFGKQLSTDKDIAK